MENKKLKVGIFGLGLIGGSILKALYKIEKYSLVAVSKSSYMKASPYAEVSSEDINVLKSCDVVFVCSEMKKTPEVFARLEEILPPETIVSDVCSIKRFLEKEYKFNYIPGHPMAGTEFSGFENSFPELFYGAKWVLGKENPLIEEIVKELGAKPVIMNPDDHDNFAAQISHLPMLISTALFNSAEEGARKIASSGFRDTTRLALTNPELAFDMLNLNRENILSAYEKFNGEILKLLNMPEKEFKNFVINVAQKRSKMYDKNGKNTL